MIYLTEYQYQNFFQYFQCVNWFFIFFIFLNLNLTKIFKNIFIYVNFKNKNNCSFFIKTLILFLQIKYFYKNIFYLLYKIIFKYYEFLKIKKSNNRIKYSLNTLIQLNLHLKLKFRFIERLKLNEIQTVILNKPVVSKLLQKTYITKTLIRRSRFFNKTKYSFIRQECKNIVHLTLFLNITFITLIFSVYLKWAIIFQLPVVLLLLLLTSLITIINKTQTIFKFYVQLFFKC